MFSVKQIVQLMQYNVNIKVPNSDSFAHVFEKGTLYHVHWMRNNAVI